MKVSELIEKIKEMPQDYDAIIALPYSIQFGEDNDVCNRKSEKMYFDIKIITKDTLHESVDISL